MFQAENVPGMSSHLNDPPRSPPKTPAPSFLPDSTRIRGWGSGLKSQGLGVVVDVKSAGEGCRVSKLRRGPELAVESQLIALYRTDPTRKLSPHTKRVLH